MGLFVRMPITGRDSERIGPERNGLRIDRTRRKSSAQTHRNTGGFLEVEIRNAPIFRDLHKKIVHLLRNPSVGNNDSDFRKRHVGDQIFQREVPSTPNRRDIGRRFVTDMIGYRRFFIQPLTAPTGLPVGAVSTSLGNACVVDAEHSGNAGADQSASATHYGNP